MTYKFDWPETGKRWPMPQDVVEDVAIRILNRHFDFSRESMSGHGTTIQINKIIMSGEVVFTPTNDEGRQFLELNETKINELLKGL